MSTSPAVAPAGRCLHCAALVPSGAEWCSLCYADLRPRAARPRALGGENPDPAATAEALLAMLAEEEAEKSPSMTGRWGRNASLGGLLASTPGRVALVAAGAGALTGALFLLMWLVGTLVG